MPSHRLRFADFEFDVRTLELRHNGEFVAIQPRPARVLAVLAQAGGELVTRGELRQQVWGDNEHVDFEQSLKTCIKQVRGVLGDDARAPRFVETLPRRGYRFVATVEFPDRAPEAAVLPPGAGGGLRRPSSTELGLVSVVVLLLLVLLRASLEDKTVAVEQRNGSRLQPPSVADAEIPSPARDKWREALPYVSSTDGAEVATGIGLLREAEELDPDYAPVQVELARAYMRLPLVAAERLPEAREAIDRALAIDSTLATAFEMRGYLRFHHDRDWLGARADLEEAIRLDPTSTVALRVLAFWHAAAGQPLEANEVIERAIKLEPGDAESHAAAGWMHYYARHFDQAIQACGTALRLDAGAEGATYCILLSELALGNVSAAALRAREQLVDLHSPDETAARFDAAAPEQALQIFWASEVERLEEQARYGSTSTFRRLLALVMLGRRDEAIATLRGDGGDCDPPVMAFLGAAPYLDSLRTAEPFQRLVDEFRLPDNSATR